MSLGGEFSTEVASADLAGPDAKGAGHGSLDGVSAAMQTASTHTQVGCANMLQ